MCHPSIHPSICIICLLHHPCCFHHHLTPPSTWMRTSTSSTTAISTFHQLISPSTQSKNSYELYQRHRHTSPSNCTIHPVPNIYQPLHPNPPLTWSTSSTITPSQLPTPTTNSIHLPNISPSIQHCSPPSTPPRSTTSPNHYPHCFHNITIKITTTCSLKSVCTNSIVSKIISPCHSLTESEMKRAKRQFNRQMRQTLRGGAGEL